MRKLNQTLVTGLFAALASFAFAATSHGQVTNPTAVAALVHVPYITSGGEVTVATVTNSDPTTPYDLHVTWIDGATWDGIDYNCPVTPLETTYFVFESGASPDRALVSFECSALGALFPGGNTIVTRDLIGRDGIMMVAVEAANGNPTLPDTVPANVLMADSTILDLPSGIAVSVPAVHVQALAANADRNYMYDGVDYMQFPNGLVTNYIAPDDGITAELVLYTPDGRVGGGGPRALARLDGFAFDDDENGTSGDFVIDCFEIKDITDGDAFGLNVTREFGGHLVGHLQLFPATVVRNPPRRAPSHGWILQTMAGDADLDDGAFGGGASMADNAAWARQLGQSLVALRPFGTDTPGTLTGP